MKKKKKIIMESPLVSEFKFGYELEAFVADTTMNKWLESNNLTIKKNLSDADIARQYVAPYLQPLLIKYFGNDYNINDVIHFDQSLTKFNNGFELPSPKMPITITNIAKTIKLLNELLDYGVYTTDTCAFHIHLSYNDMTIDDIIWIMCNLAIDDNGRQLFSQMLDLSSNNTIDFVTAMSDDTFLDNIKECLEKDDVFSIGEYINSTKHNLIRIHPQGTLEWRGPRNFLDSENRKLTKQFFIHFFKVVLWIKEALDRRTLGIYNRDTLVNCIKINLNFKMLKYTNIDKQNNVRMNFNRFIQKIVDHPETLYNVDASVKPYMNAIFYNVNSYPEIKRVLKDIDINRVPEENLAYVLTAEPSLIEYLDDNVPMFKFYADGVELYKLFDYIDEYDLMQFIEDIYNSGMTNFEDLPYNPYIKDKKLLFTLFALQDIVCNDVKKLSKILNIKVINSICELYDISYNDLKYSLNFIAPNNVFNDLVNNFFMLL